MKDTEKFPPRQKILGRGLAERCQGNYPPRGKVLGSGVGEGSSTGEKTRDTQGSAERCLGCSVVGY